MLGGIIGGIVGLILAYLIAKFAEKQGKSFLVFFLLSIFLTPLISGVILLFVSNDKERIR
jgi:phosphotransferase system  glucose/maltose/N-acetylglucosamine-specific IIC component